MPQFEAMDMNHVMQHDGPQAADRSPTAITQPCVSSDDGDRRDVVTSSRHVVTSSSRRRHGVFSFIFFFSFLFLLILTLC